MNLENQAINALEAIKKKGISQSQVLVTETETQELELTDGQVNLCRTNTDFHIGLKGVHDGRQATVSGNRWNEKTKEELLNDLENGVKASQQDPAYGIYSEAEKKAFKGKMVSSDLPAVLTKLLEFSEWKKNKYPDLNLRSLPFQRIEQKTFLANSAGAALLQEESFYSYSLMFSGKRGNKTGSFNYISRSLKEIPQAFSREEGLEDLLSMSCKEVDAEAYTQEIKGDLVLSPYVIPGFLGFFLGQISTASLISGTSLFADKKGSRILSDKINLSSDPFHQDFATESPFSGEGVLLERGDLITEGILNHYLLDVYGANKLGQKPSKVQATHLTLQPGAQDFEEMISGIEKGLLLMRFSGGSPSPNGDFSGVAKNSFLIEGGRISRPVKEVMVSGNLVRLFSEIKEVSRQTINNGRSRLPWIHTRI